MYKGAALYGPALVPESSKHAKTSGWHSLDRIRVSVDLRQFSPHFREILTVMEAREAVHSKTSYLTDTHVGHVVTRLPWPKQTATAQKTSCAMEQRTMSHSSIPTPPSQGVHDTMRFASYVSAC